MENNLIALQQQVQELEGALIAMEHDDLFHAKCRAEEAEAERDALQQECEKLSGAVSAAIDDYNDQLAKSARLRAALQQLQADMLTFATTRPSPQQTRQKSAREMVETFAYLLKDVLAGDADTRPEKEGK